MQNEILRYPVMPNRFPFNEMLLDNRLKVGKYPGVKTRDYHWQYRGPVLLYNSSRTEYAAVKAYEYDNEPSRHQVIVGVADLVDVRELSASERLRMIANFNNIPLNEAKRRRSYILPMQIGFFFKGFRRFEKPVPFIWPAGPVRPIWTEIRPESPLAIQLEIG